MKRSIVFAVAVLLSQAAPAQTNGAACEVSKPMDGQRLLRRLSLDLRGWAPSYTEQQAQTGTADVAASTVDGFLGTEDFVKVMRHYHEELLWPNLDAADVDPLQNKLFPVQLSATTTVYMSVLRAIFLRSITQQFPTCRDAPLEYNADGSLKVYPLVDGTGQTVAMQEGWVEVEPYWAPGTTVKVCGFDAQATPTGAMCTPALIAQSPYMAQICGQFSGYATALNIPFTGAPVACDSNLAYLSGDCGCGPNLKLCTTDAVAKQLRQSLIDQQMRLIEDVVRSDAPYTDVLLRRRVSVNGPIAHYLTYQSRESFDLFGEVDDTSPIPPQLTYLDTDTWVDVDRTGRHAGVLTTPGYLLKYQSNRGRAHRYYEAFECSDFIPAGPLPSPLDACSQHTDLTQRCGCNACHAQLEPMAAHWGRFAEYGLTPLSEARYPKTYDTVCTNLTSMDQLFRCVRFYVTDPPPNSDETAFKGFLRPYEYRTPDQVAQLETGPAALAQQSIDSGRFATCTVRKMWSYFMRRTPTPDEEATVVPKLAGDFSQGGYHLRSLVKAIVTQPAYRRLP
jgi:hypothetical protein